MGTPAPFDVDAVVRRFAPVVRFHPDEPFLPSSVDWYLKRVRLIHATSAVHAKKPVTITPVLARGRVNATSLGSQTVDGDSSSGKSKGTFYLDIPNDQDRESACRGDLASAKCYVHVQAADSKRWQLIYLFFYPFNEAIGVATGITHEGDWEHIRVEVDGAGEVMRRVWFAAHAGGKWHRRYSISEGNTDGFRCVRETHPIIYSARYSHASYPKAGRQERPTAILPDDYCGRGVEWMTEDSLELLGDRATPRPGQEWLQFNGRWGELRGSLWGEMVQGPTGPAFKAWWKENGFDRLCG